MTHNEGKWHDTLQQLRLQLRRAMDGETSSYQRQMGLDYGINFGVNILRLREIAQTLPQEQELADLMWSKNVREMKLLSLMLRHPEELTMEQALRLSAEVETLEIAEQLVFRLLRFVPFSSKLLSALFSERYNPSPPSAAVPYLLLNHLSSDDRLTAEQFGELRPIIIEDFTVSDFYLPSIIYNALQRIVYTRPDLDVREICEKVLSSDNETAKTLATDIMTIIKEEA